MATKVCRTCKEELDTSCFYRQSGPKAARDGLYGQCKQCQNAAVKAWQKANPEKAREINLRSERKRKPRRNAASRQYYWDNAERMREASRQRLHTLRDAAYVAYGGYVCKCCGEDERMFLNIDHVNNDGAAHRKTVRSTNIYSWLRDNGYPSGFQILCANCNHGKRMNGGVCPHQTAVRLEA